MDVYTITNRNGDTIQMKGITDWYTYTNENVRPTLFDGIRREGNQDHRVKSIFTFFDLTYKVERFDGTQADIKAIKWFDMKELRKLFEKSARPEQLLTE